MILNEFILFQNSISTSLADPKTRGSCVKLLKNGWRCASFSLRLFQRPYAIEEQEYAAFNCILQMFSYNIARKRLSGNGKVGAAVYVVVSRKKTRDRSPAIER